jgi:hypothetical protein
LSDGAEALKAALAAILKEETIGQLYARRRIALAITAIDLGTHRSSVFKTKHVKQALGEDHPNFASPWLHLGELYYARAECKQAEERIEEALPIDEKALGSKHPNSLTCSRLIPHCFAKPIERPTPPRSMSASNKYERIESH